MRFVDRPKAPGGDSGGPTLYLRLKDGEAVNIIPRGEIYEFYSVFGTRGEVTSSTPGAKLRFKMNVIVNESGTLKAKILEFGMTIYDQLAEINKVCDVTKTKIRLSRKGSGKSDTMYMLLPVVNEPISAKVMATIEAIPLHVLNQARAKQGPSDVQAESKIGWDAGGFPPDFGDPPEETDASDLPF